MSPSAWITVSVITLVMAALVSGRVAVDLAMLGGLTVLVLIGEFWPGLDILGTGEALAGFSHSSIVMIGGLFVVAAGLQETGGIEAMAQRLLGRPRTTGGAQIRLMVPVAIMSGFMNNTPIVAMYLPIVNDWARKLRVSPSKLFMPLSFAAILGGKISLIGTASNLVLIGMYLKWIETTGHGNVPQMSGFKQFWGVAAVGIPTTIAGILFIVLLSRWLLPERRPANPTTLDARKYQVEMMVLPSSPIVGRTIEEAGLRHLPGLFLTDIERDGQRLHAVPPDEKIRADDRLAFVGIVESVVDLRKIRGLVPATDQVSKVSADVRQRAMVEAVISHGSPLAGRSVRRAQFRTRYNAAIIAVHRHGEHIQAKVGDIVLRRGDTLLLDTNAQFVEMYRNSDDFYLVSQVQDARPIHHDRSWIALCILGALVVTLAGQFINPVVAVLVAALAMVATRCLSATIARNSIHWQVLIVIASALGMGRALETSGAAGAIANGLLETCHNMGLGGQPQAMLAVIFVITAIFSQLITNNGAAVLMFPIAMLTVENLGVNPEPFLFSLMAAAGASYMSPVAYQTNLMVYGPGGYRFVDFLRLGIPLTLVVALVTVLVAPLFFPF